MAFVAGKNPSTGVRAIRVDVYEFLKARPVQSFSVPELVRLTGFSASTLWSTLSSMTKVREVAETYPHVHKVGEGRFAFDPSIERGVLPSRKELVAAAERKRVKGASKKGSSVRKGDVKPVAVVKGSVSQVSESVFGLKPVPGVRVMRDASGARFLVSQEKGRTEIVQL